MVGHRLATIPGQTAVSQNGQPYKLRVLKEHQIIDGCCEPGDFVHFRIPLRGALARFITPTCKNVFNKFSVRFFIRVVFYLMPIPRDSSQVPDTDEAQEGALQEAEEPEEEEINSNYIEVVFWR